VSSSPVRAPFRQNRGWITAEIARSSSRDPDQPYDSEICSLAELGRLGATDTSPPQPESEGNQSLLRTVMQILPFEYDVAVSSAASDDRSR